MKILCVFAALFVLPVLARAAAKVPKGVFLIAQYEDALKQAKEQKKPLAVVVYDDVAEGKKAEDAAAEAFKAVAGFAVTIAVSPARSGDDLNNLAPPLVTAVNATSPLRVPLIMLCAPTEDVVWKIMSSTSGEVKDIKKLFREGVAEAKPAITAHFAAKTPPAMVQPGDQPLIWPLIKGTGYKAAFGKVEGEQLFLKNEKGELGQGIDLKTLRPAAARYAKILAGLGDAPAPAAESKTPDGKPGVEKWTNSKGKEIEATFVKLAGNKVTLRLATGKDYTLSLADLSDASQARAKELAANAGK